MIEGYWWQGMRQPVAGYGGTLWIEGSELGGDRVRVYFGATYLPITEVLSPGLIGVSLSGFRPAPRTPRTARIRLMFDREMGARMQIGGTLTLHPDFAAPEGEIARYTRPDRNAVPLVTACPLEQIAVHLSFLPEIPPRGFLQWGAHRLDLLGMDHGGTLFVQIPPGTPAGTACVCLREGAGRPVWGPPLTIRADGAGRPDDHQSL